MRYLVASGLSAAQLPKGCHLVADGETISFEQAWSFGAPLIALVDDGADLAALTSKPAVSAFLVEGIEPPGAGQAFAIGAHRMRDADAFKPYAARVADVIKDYGCRYLQALCRARSRRDQGLRLPLYRTRRRGHAAVRDVRARSRRADGVSERGRRGGVLFFGILRAATTDSP